jgi:NADP-dependent 3-hydroxy acid dehydrogenase YdfG
MFDFATPKFVRRGSRTMKNIIVITGPSSGFGALTARALAEAGHTVYASMRETTGRNAPQVKEIEEYAAAHSVELRPIELNARGEGCRR